MEIALPTADLIGRLQKRLLANFADIVVEWSGFVTDLTRWEDDHLLDNPSPELLADHKATLERFLAFGRFLSLGTEEPDFPDRELAEIVSSTLVVLQDKLRMWHGPRMSQAESDRILQACFPDEP
jgi:hypothetical protein